VTPDHLAFCDTFGFLVFRRHLTPAETAEISRQFDELMQTQNPFGPAERVYDPAFLEGGGPRRQSMLGPLVELGHH